MKYKVESIGASFATRDISALSSKFDQQSKDGWELHLVFPVEKQGCLGSKGETTYLAVYKREN